MGYLDNAKVGDKVLIDYGRYGKEIAIIEKITPKYVVAKERYFRKSNGSIMGETPRFGEHTQAYLLSPEEEIEVRKEFFAHNVVKKMYSYKYDLTYEEAKIINDIMKKHEAEDEKNV